MEKSGLHSYIAVSKRAALEKEKDRRNSCLGGLCLLVSEVRSLDHYHVSTKALTKLELESMPA